MNFLRRNYQRASTNRFVVDSPRFWRKEFHPRFKNIFSFDDFLDVVIKVNNNLSFPLDINLIDNISIHLFEYFSEYRFIAIPSKSPDSPKQFLSELYFTLLDILGQISYTEYEIIKDDFNLVTHKAETGKQDTAKVGTNEKINQGDNNKNELNMATNTNNDNSNTTSTENTDDETEQNTKFVSDVYLSPQNQGAVPVKENKKHSGVDGIDIGDASPYTTNKNNQNTGDSIKNKTNRTSNEQQSDIGISQDNDVKTSHEKSSNLSNEQMQENTLSKNDNYIETLDYNKGARLQNFLDLNNNRFWYEIINRLSYWILRLDIATSETNYLDSVYYE